VSCSLGCWHGWRRAGSGSWARVVAGSGRRLGLAGAGPGAASRGEQVRGRLAIRAGLGWVRSSVALGAGTRVGWPWRREHDRLGAGVQGRLG
jgi:hypothetical protein